MGKKPKSKHRRKVERTRGVISIFLCIVLSPMLTIASALVEAARYQETAATVQEMINCASLSTMADYDSYLQERFGLFAVDQGTDVKSSYNENMSNLTSVLGKAAKISNTNTAKGELPLSDSIVMGNQINDFSESSVMTEILLEDLNLEDLLKKLNQLKGLEKLSDTISGMADVATKVQNLVEAVEELKSHIETVQQGVTNWENAVGTLSADTEGLIKKMYDNGYTLDTENEADSLESMIDTYLADIVKIYNDGTDLYSKSQKLSTDVQKIPEKLTNVQTKLTEVKTALAEVKTNMSEVAADSQEGKKAVAGDAGAVSELGNEAKGATAVFDAIVDSLETAIEDAAGKFQEDTVTGVKNAVTELMSSLKEEFKINSYTDIKTYFAKPLSDEAKADLKELIAMIPDAWEAGTPEALLQAAKSKFIPDVVDFSSLKATVTNIQSVLANAINNAKNSITSTIESALSDLLTSLVNAVENLFSLEVFYDPHLNAVLDEATQATLLSPPKGHNGMQEIVNGIAGIKAASQEFTSKLGTIDFLGTLKAMAKMLTGLKTIMDGIVDEVKRISEKISKVAGYLTSDQAQLYDLLLMSAYMAHNLPDRTDRGATSVNVKFGKGFSTDIALNNSALTGYEYNNIVRDSSGKTSFKGAELEYIAAGTTDEIANQTITFMDIYLIRFLLNIAVVFTDPDVAAMAAAATIASWVVYLLVLLGEPFVDTIFLVNGESTYLMKNGCYLSPSGIPELLNKLSSIAFQDPAVQGAAQSAINGIDTSKLGGSPETKVANLGGGFMEMDYDTHMLLVIMFTVENDDILNRFANIVQLEAKNYYDSKETDYSFSIKKAYTSLYTETTVKFSSMIDVFSYNGKSLMKKTLKRTCGY